VKVGLEIPGLIVDFEEVVARDWEHHNQVSGMRGRETKRKKCGRKKNDQEVVLDIKDLEVRVDPKKHSKKGSH